jgi:hypothetical protein
MAANDSSFARRTHSGPALGAPLEVDALERAAADIRPSWAPDPPENDASAPDGAARAPMAHAAEAGAPAAPAPSSADVTWRMPALGAHGLGRDDTTETDLVLAGSRRVLRNTVIATALALGGGLALLLVRATQPLPAPARPARAATPAAPAKVAATTRAAPATPPETAPPSATAAPATAQPEPAAAQPSAPAAHESETPAAQPAEPARAASKPARVRATSESSDSRLARSAKRVAGSGGDTPAAKPPKKASAAPKARPKKGRERTTTTPPEHLQAGFINDNPF